MGHFIKNTHKTYTPSRLASLAIDRITDDNQCVLARWHLRYGRKRGERWTALHREFAGDNPLELWDLLRDLSRNESRLYLICEDGADGLTLAGFWDEVESCRLSIRPHGQTASSVLHSNDNKKKRYLPLVMSSNADVIGCLHERGSIRIIHPKNHGFGVSREATLPTLFPDDEQLIRKYISDKFHDWPIEARSLAMLRWYQHLSAWWTVGNCGPWQDTIGAMGMAWFKKHVPKRSVLVHDCEQAHALECAACFGGRQQVFYFGRQIDDQAKSEHVKSLPKSHYKSVLDETLYEVDFRSMYASIMRDERFPTKLLERVNRFDHQSLYNMTNEVDIMATVRLNTNQPWHPWRRERGVCYPTGVWLTTLTTPEYRYAYENHMIVDVCEVYRYSSGRPLKEFAERALGMRMVADRVNDQVGAILFKSVANALTGKFAARKCRWIDAPKVRACLQWGEFGYSPAPPAKPTRARAIAGRVQILDRTDTRTPGLTAIYAHITAYGRLRAWRVIQAAGERECVYWDTDGGLFTRAGIDNLRAAGLPFGSEPGQLRECGEIHCSVHKAPKRMVRDGKYTISGIPSGFTVDSRGVVSWAADVNGARQGINPELTGVGYQISSLAFGSIRSSVPADSSGWASPLIVSDGSLISSTPEEASSIFR